MIFDDTTVADLWVSPYVLGVVTVAIELGIFDDLAVDARSLEDLASKHHLHRETLNAMLHVLIAQDILVSEQSAFRLSELGKTYFFSKSQYFRGPEFEGFYSIPVHKQIVKHLKRANEGSQTFADWWQAANLSQKEVQSFIRGMQSMIQAPASALAKTEVFGSVRHLVDAGGGSGACVRSLVANHPTLKTTIFDLPAVCNELENYILKDERKRIKIFPGDFFKGPWPIGDALLFSNVLHDWPIEKCKELLASAAKSLKSDSGKKRIFIIEALLDESRTSPLMVTVFNMHMKMAFGGQQFTFSELSELLMGEGFERPEVFGRFGYYSLVGATLP